MQETTQDDDDYPEPLGDDDGGGLDEEPDIPAGKIIQGEVVAGGRHELAGYFPGLDGYPRLGAGITTGPWSPRRQPAPAAGQPAAHSELMPRASRFGAAVDDPRFAWRAAVEKAGEAAMDRVSQVSQGVAASGRQLNGTELMSMIGVGFVPPVGAGVRQPRGFSMPWRRRRALAGGQAATHSASAWWDGYDAQAAARARRLA